jgi:hypothetical protein
VTAQSSPGRYPTGGDYVDALQHPVLAFTDPHLKAGKVKSDPFGMPEPVSGNFASVFQVETGTGQRWAIKCFVRADPDRYRRYAAIDAALQALRHPALIDFDYQADGVMIAGVRYPMLKMRWVQAQGLMPWLESQLSHPDRILAVAEQFAQVVTALEQAGIAHGDLQHGNLLITGNNELKLIDYDGMYVPAIAGLPPNERGLVNYQHPRRADADYGPGLDRFSAWVIYTSLHALAARPDLWRRLRATDDDTKLLLASADYLDPATSIAFRELRAAGPPHLARLADQLAVFARATPAQIPPLEAVPVSPVVSPVPAARSSGTAAAPDWLADHLPARYAAPAAPSAAPAATPSVYSFAGRHLNLARLAAFCILLAAGGGVAAALGTAVLAVVPAIAWAAVALAGAMVIAGTYRAHPLVAARREARHAYATAQQELASAQTDEQRLREAQQKLHADRAAQQQQLRQGRDTATRTRDNDTARAQHQLQQTLQGIENQRAHPSNQQQYREHHRLTAIAEQHVQAALARAVIANNPPHMINTKLAAALAANGFRTAADFVDYHTVSGRGQYDKTYIKRTPSDYGTYVENIGEGRAKSLLQWRDSIRTNAESRAPRALTLAQRQEVAAEIQQLHAGFNLQQENAKQRARAEIDQARAAEKAAQAALDTLERQQEADATTKRANLERRITGAQNAVTVARRNAQYRHAELEPMTKLSLGSYTAAIVKVAA